MNINSSDELQFLCPYCGKENYIFPDYSHFPLQKFIYDCETCCKPIELTVRLKGRNIVDLIVEPENQ